MFIDEIEETEENKRERKGGSRRQLEEEPFSWKKEIISWIRIIVVVVVIILFLDNVIIANSRVSTGSMENTIMSHSRVIGSRLAYTSSEPERGDVAIFRFPDNREVYYVKRVIELPGEMINVVDGGVHINDSQTPLDEPYLPGPMERSYGPYTMLGGCYFMMGDNGSSSLGARFWKNQFVSKKDIVAKALSCYYPKIGKVE